MQIKAMRNELTNTSTKQKAKATSNNSKQNQNNKPNNPTHKSTSQKEISSLENTVFLDPECYPGLHYSLLILALMGPFLKLTNLAHVIQIFGGMFSIA